MSSAIAITDATFETEVLQSPRLTVVDLWAEWCAPCKRIEPILDQIAAEYAGTIKVTKLNVDSNPVTPTHFGVTGIPTLLVFKDGQLADTIIGFLPKHRLLAKFGAYLN